RFLLLGGETNFKPTCDDTRGAFMVWDATDVLDGKGGFIPGRKFKMLSEVRATQGTYADGHTPYNALGCSVHWFEEHPSFHDGGLRRRHGARGRPRRAARRPPAGGPLVRRVGLPGLARAHRARRAAPGALPRQAGGGHVEGLVAPGRRLLPRALRHDRRPAQR